MAYLVILSDRMNGLLDINWKNIIDKINVQILINLNNFSIVPHDDIVRKIKDLSGNSLFLWQLHNLFIVDQLILILLGYVCWSVWRGRKYFHIFFFLSLFFFSIIRNKEQKTALTHDVKFDWFINDFFSPSFGLAWRTRHCL